MAKYQSSFEQLTWEDVTTWAGTKSLSRGKSYKKQVRDLRVTKDGGILAWVDGTQPYATMVNMDSSGKLSAICSCPNVWNPCKHGVALVLAYLDALKSRQDVPEASLSDQRFQLIEEKETPRASDSYPGGEEEDEIDSEFEEMPQGLAGPREPISRPVRTRRSNRVAVVYRTLENMTKDQLVEFVVNLIDEYPNIGIRIEEKEDLKSGRIHNIVGSIRAEIEKLSSEPAWRNHWSGEGNIPDYSHIRDRLESLLSSGHADEVLELGNDLWSLGNEQVGSSDDEGETGDQIVECMKVVFRAVPKSTLSSRDQILLIIDAYLEDDFGLLHDPEDSLAGNQYDKNAWGEVADTLLNRLDNLPLANKKDDFSVSYKRRQIMDWAIMALEISGREREIIPLLKREAPVTQCYGILVERLLAAGMMAEAKTAAVEGFQLTIDKAPGIAWDIEAKLRRMAEEYKELAMVAAYRALEFFNHPSLDTYKTLKKEAEAAGEWPQVREAAIAFLQTGVRSDVRATSDADKQVCTDTKLWPLPDTEILLASGGSKYNRYPDISALIGISIYEKDIPEVLRWYEMAKKKRDIGASFHNEVAEAVRNSHPDVSLGIWWNLAESQINLVKPAAYEVAARHLRQMRDIYQRTQRLDEWTTLIKNIRFKHKPKRSLMKVLDSLEGKRIIDT